MSGQEVDGTASHPVKNLTTDLTPYLIGAVPLLIPLLAISVLEDPAVFRILVWQGKLAVMSIAMLQQFLPLVVASFVFVVIYRFAGREHFRTAATPALVSAGVLLVFAPIALAIAEFGLLAATLTLLWPRRKRWHARRNTFILAAVLAFGSIVPGALWSGYPTGKPRAIPRAIAGRALGGLPREIAVERDGTVHAYHLAASGDGFTTVISGYPSAVVNIKTDDLAVRLPCRHHNRGVERSLADLLLTPAAGGTAYCEDLRDCLNAVPDASARMEASVVKGCLREASG